MRPALNYGRESTHWTLLLEPIVAAAVERLPLLAGTSVYPIFDLATTSESMQTILDAAARELGYRGRVQLQGAGDDAFAQAISASGNLDSGRARQLLGWRPTRLRGFAAGMHFYALAWEAHYEWTKQIE